MLIRLLLLSIIPLLLFASADRALQRMKIEQRVALVIGNNQYDSKKLSNLRNPINDARAMRSKLKNLGFKVYYGENLTKRQMDKKLDKFSQKLSNGGVGLFFFAGHGIEYKRENYLMAKNSNVDDKNDVKYESLPLSKILDTMQDSGNRLNIVLLDACRNDPFSRSGGGGLAKSTAKGTFIVYATSPGDVASDGSGKHGVFTSQILKHIDALGVPIERVFKRVKIGVINSTQQNQRPWVSNDITGDFYFKLPTNGRTTSVVPMTNSKKPKSEAKATHTRVNSSFSFKDETPTNYFLTINTTPNNARVQIINIKAKYKDGIILKKGTYKIKVSKSGYTTKNGNIDLKSNLSLDIELKKSKFNNNEALIIKESFETYLLGTPTSPWKFNKSWGDSNAIKIVDSPVSNGTKSIKVKGLRGWTQGVYLNNSLQNNDVKMIFNIYIPSGNSSGQAPGSVGYGGVYISFVANNNGTYNALINWKKNISIKNIEANKWHTLTLNVNWDKSQGELLYKNKTTGIFNFTQRNTNGWNSDISLNGNNSSETNTIYIDDIKLYKIDIE